jgi:hypothetical protein
LDFAPDQQSSDLFEYSKGQTSGSSRTVVADKGSFSEVSKGEVTNSELENGAESPDIARGKSHPGPNLGLFGIQRPQMRREQVPEFWVYRQSGKAFATCMLEPQISHGCIVISTVEFYPELYRLRLNDIHIQYEDEDNNPLCSR